MWRARPRKNLSQRGPHVDGMGLSLGKESAGLLLLRAQALLLACEHLIGHEPLVGELHEPRLVVLELSDRAGMTVDVALDDAQALVAVGLDVGPDRFLRLLREPYRPVMLFDRPLDERRGVVR